MKKYNTTINLSIEQTPTANVRENVAGEWVKSTKIKPFGDDTVQCNKCGFYTACDTNYNFCPNCGADMRGEKNEQIH